MKKLFIICLLILGLASCNLDSYTEVKNAENINDTSKVEVSIPEIVELDHVDEQWNDSIAEVYAEDLKLTFDNIPYAFRNNGKLFFIVERKVGSQTYQGVIDSVGGQVVPLEFKKIGNPGLICKDFVEVTTFNNLHGLYNISNGVKTTTEYDVFYPSFDTQILAFTKNKKGMFSIDLNGCVIVNNVSQPDYNKLAKHWSKEFEGKRMIPFHEFGYFSESIIMPSYMTAMKFPMQIIETEEFDFMEQKVNLSQVKSSGGFSTFLTEFIESGVGVRESFYYSTSNLLILNNQNEIVKSQAVSGSDFKVINDTLIQIKYQQMVNEQGKEYYYLMSNYEYYILKPEGQLIPLKSDRLFGCTSFVKLTPAYFMGEYEMLMTEEDLDIAFKNDEDREYKSGYWTSVHLSIEALDIMRNEIFASYGLKFTTEKWKNYFANKPWYKGIYDNVDDKLTEIEKHNIQIILDTKAEMKGKEEEFTKKTMITTDERAG